MPLACYSLSMPTDIDIIFTPAITAAISELRAQGCAITVFLPGELRDADADHVEDAMVSAGWNAIELLATEPSTEDVA